MRKKRTATDIEIDNEILHGDPRKAAGMVMENRCPNVRGIIYEVRRCNMMGTSEPAIGRAKEVARILNGWLPETLRVDL